MSTKTILSCTPCTASESIYQELCDFETGPPDMLICVFDQGWRLLNFFSCSTQLSMKF